MMKKTLSLLMSAVLCAAILSGCSEAKNVSNGESFGDNVKIKASEKAPESAEETSAPDINEAPDETTATEAAPAEAAAPPAELARFTLSLDDETLQGMISYAQNTLTALFDGLVSGVPADTHVNIEGVKLNSWEVKSERASEEYGSPLRYDITLTLDVAESDNEYMPVGKADYSLVYRPGEDRSFLPLRKVGEELDEGRIIPIYDAEHEHVSFCNSFTAFFSHAFEGDEVTDFSAPDPSVTDGEFRFYATYLAMRYGGLSDYQASYAETDEAMRSVLGFSADAIGLKSDPALYFEGSDTVELPGRGAMWYCGYLVEDGFDDDGNRVVTIDYYEDEFYFLKSQTYRYTVRETDDGYSMLKMERLFITGRGILGGSV